MGGTWASSSKHKSTDVSEAPMSATPPPTGVTITGSRTHRSTWTSFSSPPRRHLLCRCHRVCRAQGQPVQRKSGRRAAHDQAGTHAREFLQDRIVGGRRNHRYRLLCQPRFDLARSGVGPWHRLSGRGVLYWLFFAAMIVGVLLSSLTRGSFALHWRTRTV